MTQEVQRRSRAAAVAVLAGAALVAGVPGPSPRASSHREAPLITATPKVDATDFYIFRSYEAGREGFVTMIANYLPLQDPYGGPNYFALDPAARYEIRIDNDGDAREDLTFRFRFRNEDRRFALPIGPSGDTRSVAVPLINIGPIAAGDTAFLNRIETYTLEVVRGRDGRPRHARNADTGAFEFVKPVDHIGLKSIANYEAYAREHVYDIEIPGCATEGRMFVGQRKDPFVVNLGEIFDLVNLSNPVGARDAETDDLADKNVTALALEVPIECLLSRRGGTVIGAWTTASLRQPGPPGRRDDDSGFGRRGNRDGSSHARHRSRGDDGFRQVSRLSAPLVNEVVIGLKDKDRFNASEPRDDAQFLTYVTHPTLPALIEILFGSAGVQAPTVFPRHDLVAAFLTGLDGLNRTAVPAEMLRLNTAIAPKPAAEQHSLAALGNDLAGFPNGRRPGDDVVDIELRVAMGALLPSTGAPSGQLPFTDGAYVDATFFDSAFPYLRTPIPGSPSTARP